MLTLLRRRAMGAAAGAAALAIACSWVGLGPQPAFQPSAPEPQRDSVESVARQQPPEGREQTEASPSGFTVPLDLDLQADYMSPPVPDPNTDTWAEAVLARLTLRQKVAQMIMPWVLGDYVPEGVPATERLRDFIEEHEVGGLIMSVGTPTEVAVKLNALQRRSRLPLLVGADLESGAGFRLFGAVFVPNGIVLGGATMFPTQMALGATREPGLAYEQGRITALEARAVGIHLTFAPVLDVNNNPDNPIINVRSYGEDPELVARMGAAYVRGAQDYGLVATGKHFPGHGDTGVDSHLDLPVINVDRRRLDAVELAPYREVIGAGLGAIMSAHIAVPSLTRGEVVPSTLSRRILTDLLRDDLDFGGLIVTDAMDMDAVDRRYDRREAAVLAVEAGTDLLLMPPDVELAIQGLVGAVASGRINEERIDQSVLRILRVKQRLGLHQRREVDIDAIPKVVGIPEHVEVAQQAADRSVTLLRDEKGAVPLSLPAGASVLSVTYRGSANLLAGRFFHAELRNRYTAVREVYVGPETPSEVYDRILADARMADLVIVSPYVVAVAYGGSVAVPPEFSQFITALAEAGTRHVVVSFGNPYLISEFPEVSSYLLAWSPSEVSQRAAARALLGRLPINGRTPTRIPPFFEIGDGIQRPSRAEPQR